MVNIIDAFNKVCALTDYNFLDNITKRHEFRKKTILDDKYLTTNEKSEVIKLLNEDYDYNKVLYGEGEERFCENCEQECLATLYCEHCLRNYFKTKFSNWSSRNDAINNLIRLCQNKTLHPKMVVEWIPYDDLQNIEYLTKGGCSEIYLAEWTKGRYIEWDNKEQQLKRVGSHKVILKKLENIKSANRTWFDEAKSHLSISNKWIEIVQCHGITQNPLSGKYFLVMYQMDLDLKTYLNQNHNKLTWKERIKITVDIINALDSIHRENEIHRDLHSGNILYSKYLDLWFISDFGFCGPVDKPLKTIYGNLPYIAPEVIDKKEYNFASDIYSIAMLMWEISSGQSPFSNYKHDYHLAKEILSGMRPKIKSYIPLEYESLMEQCWNADPKKRPNINDLWIKVRKISTSYYQDDTEKQVTCNQESYNSHLQINYPISRSDTSNIYQFGNSTADLDYNKKSFIVLRRLQILIFITMVI
ncbi:kinase-like domain-containing protein [Glomus cerebriforme]|uniref:Kinase-like domain-containing protein n=1 Tax=Glomus cerebriforme TaxID=658196 RepID=A0A397S0V0_9GLOM|nr:kinase-like domain-containing protein [Glomus cerebriforme]